MNKPIITADCSDTEPWRIKRLETLWRILEYRFEDWSDAVSIVNLRDHEGLLTVEWSSAPGKIQREIVEEMWSAVFNEYEIEHRHAKRGENQKITHTNEMAQLDHF